MNCSLKGNDVFKMANWYSKLTREKKDLVLLSAFEIIVFVCLCPLALIGYGSWTLGWLVGGAVTILNYWLMVVSSSIILNPDNGTKMSSTFLGLAAGGLRYLLMAALLVIGAICTYKSEWFDGFSAFNVYAIFLAYLPLPFLLLISHFVSAKKEGRKNV